MIVLGMIVCIPLRNVPGIVLVSLQDVLAEVEGAGRSCGVTAVLALSAVIGCPIHTFWPPLSGSLEPSLSCSCRERCGSIKAPTEDYVVYNRCSAASWSSTNKPFCAIAS